MTRESDQMSDQTSDNGSEWVWMIGYSIGLGHVAFQRPSTIAGNTRIGRARRFTAVTATDTPNEKMDFDFRVHPFHLFGVWPIEMNVSAGFYEVFAEAPAKVRAVLEETWNPQTIKPATNAELSRLGDMQ